MNRPTYTHASRAAETQARRPSPQRAPSKPARRQRAETRAARDLPLAAARLHCGHGAREFGLQRGDWLWCDTCSDITRVIEVLAS